ncbi:MAG: ceramidase domain-containing protein [Arenimonas sp.]
MSRSAKLALLGALSLVALAVLWAQGPIAQDPAYHRFADAATWFGIPNFWNVASNLPFPVFGLWGLARVLRGPLDPLAVAQRPAWIVFFLGATLVGFGSGYYHLHPDDAALVWDRLPMTLAFMALFAVLVGEHVEVRWGRGLLWPLLIVGVVSVLWWKVTEAQGHGDLRPYAAVQFLPLILIPGLLLAFPQPGRGPLWAVLALYALGKALEYWDAAILDAIGVTGGHAFKQVAAGVGIGVIAWWLGRRAARGNGSARG